MTFIEQLQTKTPYSGRVEQLIQASELQSSIYYVYVLTIDEKPIVLGHGKRNRARVIFDSRTSITPNHLKAITVRLYLLFAHDNATFGRYVIPCNSKDEAAEIEADLHQNFGGNSRKLPESIEEKLLTGLDEHPFSQMVLRMALCSSFDAIADLTRWRAQGILDDSVWLPIKGKLELPYDL